MRVISAANLEHLSLGTHLPKSVLSLLGRALATSITLKTLQLFFYEPFSNGSGEGITMASAFMLQDILHNSKSLERLLLKCNFDFNDEHALNILGQGIQTNTSLRAISFQYCDGFTNDVLSRLVPSLSAHPTLERLFLPCPSDDFGEMRMDVDDEEEDVMATTDDDETGLELLANSLMTRGEFPSLTTLHLTNRGPIGNSLSPDSSRMFFGKLALMRGLQNLHVDIVELTLGSAEASATALRFHSNLQHFKIKSSKTTWASRDNFKIVFEVLKVNASLQTLDVSGNPLSCVSLSQLGCSLRQNHCVKTLILDACSITDGGAGKLAEHLPFMSNIQELHLNWNIFGISGAKRLSTTIPNHPSLLKVEMAQSIYYFGERRIHHYGSYEAAYQNICYNLRVNRFKSLLQSTLPDSLWPTVFVKSQLDPYIMFTLLREEVIFVTVQS